MRLRESRANRPGYGGLSQDVLHRLELSRQRAEEVQTREMRCPICGFLVQIIPVTQTDIVFAKCHKCKFTGALDPAYFRRMKRLDAYRRRLNECARSNKR